MRRILAANLDALISLVAIRANFVSINIEENAKVKTVRKPQINGVLPTRESSRIHAGYFKSDLAKKNAALSGGALSV